MYIMNECEKGNPSATQCAASRNSWLVLIFIPFFSNFFVKQSTEQFLLQSSSKLMSVDASARFLQR